MGGEVFGFEGGGAAPEDSDGVKLLTEQPAIPARTKDVKESAQANERQLGR
jgi:hypothetical protein